MYWRDEMSGKLLTAVTNYWSPYADTPDNVPELDESDISALRWYILHWAKAPCWQNNPHIDPGIRFQLAAAIEMANAIDNREDITKTLRKLLELGIDPF